MTKQVIKWELELQSLSPFSVMEEGGLLKDAKEGNAMIAGSSLAGMFRKYCMEAFPEETKRFFGDKQRESSIVVHDFFCGNGISEACIRNKIKKHEETGTGRMSRLYTTQSYPKGAAFSGTIECSAESREESDRQRELLKRAVLGIASGDVRIGGMQTIGYGRFAVTGLREQRFDLTNPEALKRYVLGTGAWEDILSELSEETEAGQAFLLRARVSFEAPYCSDDTGDALPGEIRGSALKGALRLRCKAILKHVSIEEEQYLNALFGALIPGKKTPVQGKLIFEETAIEAPMEESRLRYVIDRFSGGNYYGGILKETVCYGETVFTLRSSFSKDNALTETEKGLLLYALRDLASGYVPMGQGAAKGYGRARLILMELLEKGERELYEPGKNVPPRMERYSKAFTNAAKAGRERNGHDKE